MSSGITTVFYTNLAAHQQTMASLEISDLGSRWISICMLNCKFDEFDKLIC